MDSVLLVLCFVLFCFVVPGVEPRGILPPCYTPSPIFLYFILKLGLMKLQRASLRREEKERERERERKRKS